MSYVKIAPTRAWDNFEDNFGDTFDIIHEGRGREEGGGEGGRRDGGEGGGETTPYLLSYVDGAHLFHFAIAFSMVSSYVCVYMHICMYTRTCRICESMWMYMDIRMKGCMYMSM